MSITLRLDAGALDKIFRDDNGEIKLELTQSICEEFARKHLKALMNTEAMQHSLLTIEKAMEREGRALMEEHIGKFDRKSGSLILSDEIKAQLKKGLDAEASKEIMHRMSELKKELLETIDYYKKDYFPKLIEKYTKSMIDEHFEDSIQKEILKRIKELKK